MRTLLRSHGRRCLGTSVFLNALFLLVFLVASVSANGVVVGDVESLDLATKTVKPGDTILLKDGTWTDAKLVIRVSGTAEDPVTIKAQTPGKVIFRGDSRISFSGEHIVVEGLWFQNPTGDESIVFRTGSRELAHDCRVTQCAVTNDQPDSNPRSNTRFVSIYGSGHRVDHCLLAGKTTGGPTVVVWLAKGQEAAHQIDHNFFGPRPRLGRNGGETLRVGDSKTSQLNADCVVEHNVFEKCDGEAECISNKSCGNVYRNNRFVEVSGTLTLRHGNDCRVVRNVFEGRGARGSGGVRVIGGGHLVEGNLFQGLRGSDERSALCFMLGVPDSSASGYFQVKRTVVTGNQFLNCKHNILIGMKGDKKAILPPVATTISENVIQTDLGKAFEILCDVTGVTMKNNQQTDRPGKQPPSEQHASDPVGPTWHSKIASQSMPR